MNPRAVLAAIVAVLVAVLTWFLFQGLAPDAPRHERADAVQALILSDAALQRDVLRARAGLLASYDPLVRSMDDLAAASAALPASAGLAGGLRAEVDRGIAAVAESVRGQEELVERFKSDNALLRNSLAYFNHLSGRLAAAGDRGRRTELTAEVGRLAAAMLGFADAPLPDAASEVNASLDRLARLQVAPAVRDDVRALVAHGRLVVSMLPEVDGLVARMQSAPVSERARALQAVYFRVHEQAAARADLFLALLYAAALALVGYAAWLFMRLRARARSLRERLRFESLVASISTDFINLPRDRVGDGIGEALSRMAGCTGHDRAAIAVARQGEIDPSAGFSWVRPGVDATAAPLAEMARLALGWPLAGWERQGCILVADAGLLPEGPEKAAFAAWGTRSWLSIPMRIAGEELGVLLLETVREKRDWRDDDVALLRTAAEIFAGAVARESGEAEREALQARLNQSQRLEALGTLAGGIAHEFNNILGAIRGYAEMALAVLIEDSRARRYVRQIDTAGKRAEAVVEQVLAFGRRGGRRHRPLRVEPVVAEALDLIRASFPATLSLRPRLEAGDASAMGDPTELQQVVMNLCTNAAQAMDGRGVLTVALEPVDRRGELTLSHGSLPAGRYVRLSVRDTGRGIDEAAMQHIFEPFFTTKPVGQGTGLGLSTVHGIVGEHGGALNVGSRPGRGTTFEVWLPRLAEPAQAEVASAARPPRPGRGETVLIVDDDRPLVTLGEEMLAALGYEPVGFDRSRSALGAVSADPQRFDLVLTDEIMPDMTGTELARAIHDVRPDLPIVLMSGYGWPPGAGRLQAAGIRDVLRKPLLSQALADCLARQLGR